jgi:hypothetical protein
VITFLTLPEVARRLRYEDAEGVLTPKALHACRKWLSNHGIRPSLKRGLFRVEAIETAIARIELAESRRRNRGFQSRSTRFQQTQGALHGSHVSCEGVGQVHAGDVTEGSHGTLLNSIEQVTR